MKRAELLNYMWMLHYLPEYFRKVINIHLGIAPLDFDTYAHRWTTTFVFPNTMEIYLLTKISTDRWIEENNKTPSRADFRALYNGEENLNCQLVLKSQAVSAWWCDLSTPVV